MIPIEDHKWRDISSAADGILPPGHKMEYAQFEGTGIVVRIVGPNAYVFGESELHMNEAMRKALDWFDSVGGVL